MEAVREEIRSFGLASNAKITSFELSRGPLVYVHCARLTSRVARQGGMENLFNGIEPRYTDYLPTTTWKEIATFLLAELRAI
jgi:hypothetical protein